MIGVTAKLTIQDEKVEAFESAAKDLIAKVRENEPGCLQYDLFRDGITYIFMERYADEAALNAHGKTDYFQAAQPALGACLAGPPEIRRFAAVDVAES